MITKANEINRVSNYANELFYNNSKVNSIDYLMILKQYQETVKSFELLKNETWNNLNGKFGIDIRINNNSKYPLDNNVQFILRFEYYQNLNIDVEPTGLFAKWFEQQDFLNIKPLYSIVESIVLNSIVLLKGYNMNPLTKLQVNCDNSFYSKEKEKSGQISFSLIYPLPMRSIRPVNELDYQYYMQVMNIALINGLMGDINYQDDFGDLYNILCYWDNGIIEVHTNTSLNWCEPFHDENIISSEEFQQTILKSYKNSQNNMEYVWNLQKIKFLDYPFDNELKENLNIIIPHKE